MTYPRLILGCGNFGGIGSAPAFFGMGETEPQAIELMDRAWAAGITAFDTANAYGGGRSETWIGRWLASKGSSVRDRLMLTTKVFNPVGPGPDDRGLSRKHILRQIDASLTRLQTDRIDLYLAHEWDPGTPIDETLRAFDDIVRAGKVRQIGWSNVDALQLASALEFSAQLGVASVQCVQNSFSLLDRTAERELLPLCANRGIAFAAFSPLAGGWLTGKYRAGQTYPDGSRMTLRPEPYRHLETGRIYQRIDKLEAMARVRDLDVSTLALAWVLAQPDITAAVIGPRKLSHLETALAARDVQLSRDDNAAIDALFSDASSSS